MERAWADLAPPGSNAQEGNHSAVPSSPATLPCRADAGTSEIPSSNPQQGKQRWFSPLSVAEEKELKDRCGKRPFTVENGKGAAIVEKRQNCTAPGNAEMSLMLEPGVSERWRPVILLCGHYSPPWVPLCIQQWQCPLTEQTAAHNTPCFSFRCTKQCTR